MASPLKSFYAGKNILLTGGTGFMGVTMVEKLLRSFPEVGSITMVVREKKGVSVADRKKAYFNNQVFDRLKMENAIDLCHNKINFVQGDIRDENLGLSAAIIEKLQDEVDLIVHGAATLNFSLPLKFYIDSNLRSTHDLLKIAEGCRKLNGFMYISTAFSQTRRSGSYTPEIVIDHPTSPGELLQMASRMSSEELETHAKRLTLDWYNYYAYSKNATENLISEFEHKFPIAIFRPATVGHSYTEPAPFFMGNNMGFSKVLMEAAKGLVLFSNPDANANTVPVDLTVYGSMAALYNTINEKGLKVYNYTTNNHPCSFAKAFSYFASGVPDYETVLVPLRAKLMTLDVVPSGSEEEKERKQLDLYYKFHEKIHLVMQTPWIFENTNLETLWQLMSADDKKLMPFDVRCCDWKQYYTNMFAKQFGPIQFPKFEGLSEEKRAELRNQLFYKHYMNY